MKNYAVFILPFVAVLAVLIGGEPVNAQTIINFDVDAEGIPIDAPDEFIDAVPLSDLFAPLGVVFSGGGSMINGGSILNVSGNFGVNARSGTNFLTFNALAKNMDGGTAAGPEVLNFSVRVSSISIFGSTGSDTGVLTMEGRRADAVVAAMEVAGVPGEYVELGLTDPIGFDQIILNHRDDLDQSFVFDDLQYRFVPEPSTAVSLLVVTCLSGPWLRKNFDGV